MHVYTLMHQFGEQCIRLDDLMVRSLADHFTRFKIVPDALALE